MDGNGENDDYSSDDDDLPRTPRGEESAEINPVQDDQPVHVHNAIPPTFIDLHELCQWLGILFGLLPSAVAYQWMLMYRMIRRLINVVPVRFGVAGPFHPPFAPDQGQDRNRIQPPWDDIPIETRFSPTVTIAVGENVGVANTTPYTYDPIPVRIARQTVIIPDADDNNEYATNDEFEPMPYDFAGHANFDGIEINEDDAVADDTVIGDVDGYDHMVRQALLDGLFDTNSDTSSDDSTGESGNEADNESEATTTTSDSDSDTRSVTSSDNYNDTESGNDADDECSSTSTENGSRRSSFSSPDDNDADVTASSSNDEEEPAASALNQPAALVQTPVNDDSSDEAADEHRLAGGVSTNNACRALIPYVRKSETPVIHNTPQETPSV